jgi:hypothetical protein
LNYEADDMTLRGDKTKCSVCGGGIYRCTSGTGGYGGEHYSDCPKNMHAKPAPSKLGYGVFLYSSGNSFVVRTLDTLQHPYKMENVLKVYKRKVDAERYCDGLNEGTIKL